VATVGLSTTIPLAMLSDFIFFHDIPSAMVFGGSALVIVGFLVIISRKDFQEIEYSMNLTDHSIAKSNQISVMHDRNSS
jgi:drug/metabolite transporter (DMT)-like permease